MERKKRIYCALGGFLLGVLTASLIYLIWSHISRIPTGHTGEIQADVSTETPGRAPDVNTPLELGTSRGEHTDSSAPESPTDTWNSTTVRYQGRRYQAKWWTQGEQPGGSDVWEDLGILDGQPVQPDGVGSIPIDASAPRDTALTDFKVVGYYPSWKPDKLRSVDFGVLTHVCYAFAIPTAEGDLRDLENPEAAETLIRSAHENGAKVLL